MRFLLAGELRYVRSLGNGIEEVTDEMTIEPGNQWISEAVMWINDWAPGRRKEDDEIG